MQADFGQWLQRDWIWDWFGHFTFRGEVGSVKANSTWNYYMKQLRKGTGRSVQWIRCTEFQQREVIHYHALLLNVGDARRLSYMDLWADIAGWARIYPYEKDKGASYYLSKYVVKELGEIKFSDKLQDFAVWTERGKQHADSQLGDLTFIPGMACSLDSHSI
jgi:hypothetical protein